MLETIDILLVDDEPRNLDALEAILDDPSYRLLRAENADKALKLLLENDVAAIVLDIKMPVVSGFELAQMIKGTKRFRQIPIVFLTAHLLDDRDVLTGYGAGAVDYLAKPINPQILRHKIAVFAELFRKTRALAELNETLESRVKERTLELEKSEAALREADRQKDIFLATLAHELRNPMASLRTGLGVLKREPAPSSDASRTLGAMDRQLNLLVRLVDDLLDVSRIRHGTIEMRKERCDLVKLVRQAVETVAPQLEKRRHTVHIGGRERLDVLVDPARIAQVVANLLSNASKHSPAGATVVVEVEAVEDGATVRVRDEGEGIPIAQLDQVFELFTKIARPSGQPADGLGIGLALSRQYAELHGGTLNGTSEGPGKGATFTLALPHALAEAHPPEPEPPQREAAPSSGKRLKVVLVEDNEDSAQVLSMWLSHLGHDIQLAHTGTEGLRLILDSRPDLVFCDIGLPEMSGLDVCRRVVSTMSEPPLMVALTGWGMTGDRQETVAAGFRHHLVKPVALEAIDAILEAVTLG